MKRERLTDDETALNETALLPLIDDMLNQRRITIDAINNKWGLNISVDLASGWKITHDSARAENNEKSVIENENA